MNEPAAKKSKFDAEDGEIFSEIEDASDMEDGEICSDDDVTELLKTGKNLSSTPKKVKTLPKINSEYTKGIVLVRQGDQKQPAAIILPPTKTLCIQLPALPKDTKPTPIVLPIIAGFPMPNSKNLEPIEKAYETQYSDDNSEKTESDSEMGTMETLEEPTTATIASSEPPSEENLEKTVIEIDPVDKNKTLEQKEDDPAEQDFEYYTKEVVKHRGGTWLRHTEQLPEGWTIINHHCGFPLYFQKDTRIVTWARPYYIGNSSVKHHKVPMASIPCLAYSRRNDEDKQAENFDKEADYPAKESAEIPAKETTEKLTEPTGTTEGPASSSKMCPINNVDAKMIRADKNLLESQKLRDYIRLKFDYEEVQGKLYKDHQSYRKHLQTRRDKRKQIRENKKENMKNSNKSLDVSNIEPEDQDLPTLAKTFIEIRIPDNKGKNNKPITIYLQGKSTVTILNEYCSRALRCTPCYEDQRDEIGKEIRKFVVRLPDGQQYGTGKGQNATVAKNIAALETLKMLIPGFEPDDKFMLTGRADQDLGYFDHLAITDNRLYQLCGQAGIPPPAQFLKDITHKIHGPSGAEEKLDIVSSVPNDTRWVFQLGKEKCEGKARSKKNAKHIAAQSMLQKLHPELKTWGELLRFYKKDTDDKKQKTSSDKNSDEENITALFKVKSGPNHALLGKLREMMLKVSEEQKDFLKNCDRIQPLFNENRSSMPLIDS